MFLLFKKEILYIFFSWKYATRYAVPMQMAAGETVCAVKFAPVTSKMFLSATTEESVFLNFPKSQQFSQATDSELREKK